MTDTNDGTQRLAANGFSNEVIRTALQDADDIKHFLATRGNLLTLDECRTIVDEAIVLLEGLYVHLPLKRAMYAIDPVRRLRLLQVRIERLKSSKVEQTDDLWFHREMSATLTSVRDLHTMYVLPCPFDTAIAALPFQIEDYFEGDSRRYAVTNVIAGIKWQAPATFISGVEVTHWNGIPICRAVELVGEANAGSNPEARLARGLARLTIRPLAKALPPDEESVRVRYLRDGSNEPCELIVPWRIFRLSTGQKIPPDGSAVRVASAIGLDHDSDLIRHARRAFFSRYSSEKEQSGWLSQEKCATEWPPSDIVDLQSLDDAPEYFQAKRFRFKADGPEYGYIRIRSFAIPGDTSHMTNEEAGRAAQSFLDEFVDLLERLPQTGLIIDVRDNPGGTISLGERLLQTLTPRRIQPQSFQFINSLMTLNLAKTFDEYRGWRESIERSMETTTPFSTGLPLDPIDFCNDTGQKYHGPVVLVTNALCYSTTDIFAAGFQDHQIGTVLGTDGCTGAGGANVVEHSWLNQRYKTIKDSADRFHVDLPDWKLKDGLPGGADFRVALRRSLRVGKLSGTELEDFGVVPDELHKMTKNDLLNGNVDLMTTAANFLSEMPCYFMKEDVAKRRGDDVSLTVTIQTRNVERLNVLVDGWTGGYQSAANGSAEIKVPLSAKVVDIQGYNGTGQAATLVAARKIKLEADKGAANPGPAPP